VKVALDPKELEKHPLRIGLSVIATVSVHDKSGPQLATGANRSAPVYQTQVYGKLDEEADELVRKIISTNIGDNAPAPRSAATGAKHTATRSRAQQQIAAF